MLGDSIVGVKHCVNLRGGRAARGTWAIAAVGLAALLASAIAFGVSVHAAARHAAARHAAAREHSIRVLHRPAYTFRPHRASDLAGGVMFGGLVLGLSALAAALLRAHDRRESPLYRIGTAPGVEQPALGAPAESFPLVAASGDLFVFNYAPGIEGELIADGAATPLSELAAAGRALPSAAIPGALEILIPPAAEIRARVGAVTFRVSSDERPESRAVLAPAAALDLRAMWYVAGSLAAHLAFVLWLYPADLGEDLGHDFITFNPTFEPCESLEHEEEECTGCICHTDGSVRSREEEIERARDVALSGGIIGRMWPRGDSAWSALGGPSYHRAQRLPARLVAITYPHSVSGGTLGRAAIKRRVRQYESQINHCYLSEVLARPKLGGWATIRFRIGPDGHVQGASGQGFDAAVASCVARVIESIEFPAPRNGTPATVSYPFLFRPAGPS